MLFLCFSVYYAGTKISAILQTKFLFLIWKKLHLIFIEIHKFICVIRKNSVARCQHVYGCSCNGDDGGRSFPYSCIWYKWSNFMSRITTNLPTHIFFVASTRYSICNKQLVIAQRIHGSIKWVEINLQSSSELSGATHGWHLTHWGQNN